MAADTKGFLKGDLNFHVGEDPDVGEQGPLLPLRIVVVGRDRDPVPRVRVEIRRRQWRGRP